VTTSRSNPNSKAAVPARAILEKRRGDLDAGLEFLVAHETVKASKFALLRTGGTAQDAA
jgi:hypothetical protein